MATRQERESRQERLSRGIALAIGIHETNPGGDAPNVRESELDTVAGVPASMATWEQLTMPRAITEFTRHAELRQLASPPIERSELSKANKAVNAVQDLLTGAAKWKGTAAEFATANEKEIARTGLTAERYLAVAELKREVARARADRKKEGLSFKEAAESIPEDKRLGIGVSDLAHYIKVEADWTENVYALMRLAIETKHPELDRRIEEVAEAGDGSTVLDVWVSAAVAKQLAKSPKQSDEAIAEKVAQMNNKNSKGYGAKVLKEFKKLDLDAVPEEEWDPFSHPARTDAQFIRSTVENIEAEIETSRTGRAVDTDKPVRVLRTRDKRRVVVTATLNDGERWAVQFDEGWPVFLASPGGGELAERILASLPDEAWTAAG